MNDKPLKGKVALITGCYRNLGVHTAEAMAEHGAAVIINDLPGPEAKPLEDELLARLRSLGVEAAAIQADLARSEEIKRLCDEALDAFGRVDILVNNAGPFSMDPYLEMEEAVWDRVMDVNLKAIYLMVKGLAPQMRYNGWGRVINMSAGSAYVRNHNVYTLAKKCVEVITESLAIELGPEITVNAIAPGQIFESLPVIHEFDPTFGERYTARAPLKRLVTRKEVASAITNFCMPVFDGMTGVTIRFDCGAEIPKF